MAASREKRQYKVSEVCKLADVQPYVLRYWETEFPPLAARRAGGQRNWSQEELDLVMRIRELLYGEGFTIAGAKKKLEAELLAPEPAPPEAESQDQPSGEARASLRGAISEVREELGQILQILKR